MGHAILWLASLATGVLLVALAAAHGARKGRTSLPFAAALVPFTLGALMSILTGRLHTMGLRPSYLVHSLSWTTAFVLAALGVIHVGSRARSEDGPPRAAEWPRGAILAAIFVSIAVYVGTLLCIDAGVRRELAKVKAEAVEIARSVAPTPVPDERNAEVVYRQAFEAMGDLKDRDSTTRYWLSRLVDDRTSDVATEEVAGFLREKEKALALLRKAASMPDHYFEARYVPPRPDVRMPDLVAWYAPANLLALDARHRAAKGDVRGALEDVAAIWGMARHPAGSHMLIGCMFAVGTDAVGSGPVQEVLASGPVRRADLRGFPLDPDVSFTEMHARARKMEEATLLHVAAEPYFYEVQGRECSTPHGIHWRVFRFRSWLASYRPGMRLAQELASKPYHETRTRCTELVAEAHGTPGGRMDLFGMPPWESVRASALAVAETDARHRLAVLGIAAACFRTEKGRYPKELAELVPEYISAVPVDPFDGRPLKMIREGDGIVLYSAGHDGEDDGGKDSAWDFSGSNPEEDISFCLGEAYKSRLAASRRPKPRRRSRRPGRRAPRY
ncbi:MAG: hypothetical protein ACYSU0_20580 [Planctomycetota bacterium]|jgi:hypothetical protein